MKHPLVVANWKMNPQDPSEARSLFRSLLKEAAASTDVEIGICPPFPFLAVVPQSREKNVSLGAQDVFWKKGGAFTGEVSHSMLRKVGCRWVIVGHSERRRFLGETDEMIAKKLQAALNAGLFPILCIGEESRSGGEDDDFAEVGKVLEIQMEKDLAYLSCSHLPRLTIAYEPVWAISNNRRGHAASPADALKAVVFIRKTLRRLFRSRSIGEVRILYGGSVRKENAAAFFREEGIEGALVGSASLRPESFGAILKAAQRCCSRAR